MVSVPLSGILLLSIKILFCSLSSLSLLLITILIFFSFLCEAHFPELLEGTWLRLAFYLHAPLSVLFSNVQNMLACFLRFPDSFPSLLLPVLTFPSY